MLSCILQSPGQHVLTQRSMISTRTRMSTCMRSVPQATSVTTWTRGRVLNPGNGNGDLAVLGVVAIS